MTSAGMRTYAGWMPDGRAPDPFGHRGWLWANLPDFGTLVEAAKPLALRRREAEVARMAEPPTYLARATLQIDRAIGELAAHGAPVTNRTALVTWLADGMDRVQAGRAGFDLTAPPMATRVFAGGALLPAAGLDDLGEVGPRWDEATGEPLLARDSRIMEARVIAEVLAERLNAFESRPVAAVTLESRRDAEIIDRLDLFDPKVQTVLEPYLLRLVDQRPDLRETLFGTQSDVDPEWFAECVWRHGLAKQYAREADGDVVLIVPGAYEGYSACAVEIPELLANPRIAANEMITVGFSHHPYAVDERNSDEYRARAARDDAAENGWAALDIEVAGRSARTGPQPLSAVDLVREMPAPDPMRKASEPFAADPGVYLFDPYARTYDVALEHSLLSPSEPAPTPVTEYPPITEEDDVRPG